MAALIAAIRRWLCCARQGAAQQPALDVGVADVRKNDAPAAAVVPVPEDLKTKVICQAAASGSPNCTPAIFAAKYKTVVPDNYLTTEAVCLTSDVAILGNANITGDTCVTGNVFIAGDLAIAGAICVTGSVVVLGTVHAQGDICVTGNAFVNGDCTVRGKLDVGGKFCVFGMKDIAPQQPSSV